MSNMNYQSNMDVYYTYDQEQNEQTNTKKINILIAILILFISLLFAWIYLNYFKGNELNSLSKKNSYSESNIPSETDIKTSKETLKVNIDKPLKESIKSSPIVNKEELKKASKNDLDIKTSKLNKEVSLVKTTAKVTSSSKELNSSLKSISQIKKVSVQDLNTTKKVKVESKLPLIVYHLYIVSKGETITSIAQSQYNDSSMSIQIIEANPDLNNPNNIKEGQEILLPIHSEGKSYTDILRFR
jgi:hypothetical protein